MLKQRWYGSVRMVIERWYGSVRMVSQTVERKFLNGISMDWRGACLVPLYDGKGDKYKCSNSRGISLLSVVGTVYARVLIIKKVGAGTECGIGEEQCGLMQSRGCIYQAFVVRQ